MPKLTIEPVCEVSHEEYVTHYLGNDTKAKATSARGAVCPVCDTKVAPGSIVSDRESQWMSEHKCFGMMRQFYCPHCHHIVTWVEQVDEAGNLTGLTISGPGYLRSKSAISAFLRKHPEATGVLQR